MGTLKLVSIWEKYSMIYWNGLNMTLQIAAVSVITSIIVGIILGVLRMSKNPVIKGIIKLYISFIRGTPMLIQIYIIYYSLSFNMTQFQASVVAMTVSVLSGADGFRRVPGSGSSARTTASARP